MAALAVAVGIGRFAFTPVLPMMQEDQRITVAQAGWLASGNYAGYLAGALWAMVQRARPDRAIRIALLVTSLATLAMAFVEGLASWLALRFLAGVSSAWALIHVSAWCVEQFALLRRPVLNGAVFAGVGAGILCAGVLCLALMAVEAGSAHAWLAMGTAGLGATALVWPVLGVGESAKAVLARPAYRWDADATRLVACYGAFGLGYIIPATFVPVMARQIIRDPMLFGWAWPIFGGAALASTLVAAYLLRDMSNRRVWMLSAFLMALGVASPVLVRGLLGILAGAVLVGGTFMVTTMAGLQEARRLAGASASVLIAAMTAAFAAGQIIGPLLVSALAGRVNEFAWALALAFTVLILSVVLLALPARRSA